MTARTAALALVAAALALPAWIGLRDRADPGGPAARRTAALADAHGVLDALVPVGCRAPACRVAALDPLPGDRWHARLQTPRGVRCFVLDPARFARDPASGLRGVRPRPCLR